MNNFEPMGYLASLLVLATFCMRDMVALRVVAIAGNLAFIAYSGLAQIGPVLLLHALLLPVNVLRLLELRAAQAASLGAGLGETPADPPKRGAK